jgi:nicotinamide-nucleotide amidase
MHAEVIAIGDEITSGQLLDTNSQWLSLRLEELGIPVLYHTTVGDELEALAEVFRTALGRSDIIVATGGLGPTADDLTREALAQAAGRELVFDQAAMDHIRGLFARRHRPMPEQNRLQAMFPGGSRVIANPQGTAPGIDLEFPRAGRGPSRLFALPGVPAEMKEMWQGTLAGALGHLGAGRQRIKHRRIKCFGAGESQIEAMLPDLIRRGRQPRVGINASQTTIILRITAAGRTEEECRLAMEPTVATVRQCLGDLVYGEDDDELQDVVLRLLRRQRKTLATAEWHTGGLLAEWLGGASEAGECYRGGVIIGNPAAMAALGLGSGGLAGEELVAAVGAECRERFAADYALAIGPLADERSEGSGSDEPNGRLVLALAGPGGVKLESIHPGGHPAVRKVYCAKRALNMLRLMLLGRSREAAKE